MCTRRSVVLSAHLAASTDAIGDSGDPGHADVARVPSRPHGTLAVLARRLGTVWASCRSPQFDRPTRPVDPIAPTATRSRMLTSLIVLLRAIGLICRGHQAVALENLALRQQWAALTRSRTRPHLRTRHRLFWIVLSKAWQDWRGALLVVQPDTVVRWRREWLRRRWTAHSRQKPGRPTVNASIRTLVEKMAAANPLWGAPRIHGELRKLGIGISERTVSRLLQQRHRPSGQRWHTFLTNHVTALVSMDFFTVATVSGRVLFVLVLLAHQRRPSSTSRSPSIRPPPGLRNRSLKPSRRRPRLGGS